MSMTYYEKLVRRADAVMNRFPDSVVVLDASNLKVIVKGRNPARVAKAAHKATMAGQTSVIIQKPRHEESWIL